MAPSPRSSQPTRFPPGPSPQGGGAFGLSTAELQALVDVTPSLQCRGRINADCYGWVPNTKSVWVLENPTDEQYEHLNRLGVDMQSSDTEVHNRHLKEVGAVFYADYTDHEGAKYLADKIEDNKLRRLEQEANPAARNTSLDRMIIDVDETKRRNDGQLHIRPLGPTEERV